MDKNTAIGLVLITGIFIGYGIWSQPSAEEQAEIKRIADSTATADAAKKAKTIKVIDSIPAVSTDTTVVKDSSAMAAEIVAKAAKFGAFAPATVGSVNDRVVETDKLKITFSNKGGRIKDVVLKEYTTHTRKPVHLFDPSSAIFGFNFNIANRGTFNTQNFYFTEVSIPEKVSGDKSTVVAYRMNAGAPDKYIELRYTIKGNGYDIDLQLNTRGLDGIIDTGKKLALDWKATGMNNEKSVTIERQRSSVYFKPVADDRDYLSETSEDDEEILEEPVSWVAFKQYFFTAAVISKEGFVSEGSKLNLLTGKDSAYNKTYSALLTLPMTNVGNGTSNLKLYFGPNQLEELTKVEADQFDKIIDYGWGIFGWVNKYFIYYVFNWLSLLGLGVGLTILMLTIVIKMLLMPLTYKNYQSSAKMRILKPEVDALNAKHKDSDPMKKQQEMMSLYRQTGVNPLAGCIPVLIQMPFLYAMFRFFPASMELRHVPFLWADDLASFDSIYNFGFNIPLYGDHISLFTILMCISTFIYTRMNSGNMPAPQQGMPDMRFIMYMFPFMMLFFFNNYASGLSWYYFAANVVTMIQTFVIRKYFVDEKKILATIEENKKKPAGKSKIQKRMEDLANRKGIKLPK